ncbi:class I SAM-dependent methyltransferase [Hydrogenophaga sp. BPS33]|uniref:class I SAM-dependent methyltransferase n=1 Tax=Hydrogenophaga sp. BPS33 TaxID=2651974 RepID=UPI0013204C64|nr:class I SAM-dependent methyltransferase [Hydrogenophaga sp. BPS33]QHE87753.1 class I SAM-dependent methyltransferase [Hydrogenophaga sp. BPS33]
MRCPVCEGLEGRAFQTVGQLAYGRCERCEATFLLPAHWPSPEAERAEYALHQNTTEDPGYRRFLQQVAAPLLQRLPPRQRGLDFGCGPGPVLASMLREAGHSVALFDPFFHPDPSVLAASYDFITCTEVAEHFHDPAAEFRRLQGLLRPGGWLALMTCFQTDDARFAQWHYRRDPTHVVFYRESTLRWLARRHGWQAEVPCANVVLMHKQVA